MDVDTNNDKINELENYIEHDLLTPEENVCNY